MAYAPIRFEIGAETGVLTPGRDGWVHWQLPRGMGDVVAQIAEYDDGLDLAYIAIRADKEREAVTGELLRGVPLGRLGAAVEHPEIVDAIRAARTARTAPVLDPATVSKTDLPARLAGLPVRNINLVTSLELTIPPKKSRGPRFYKEVLELYEQVKRTSHRPAPLIAAANDIDTGQVRQWVQQGRASRRAEQRADVRYQAATSKRSDPAS